MENISLKLARLSQLFHANLIIISWMPFSFFNKKKKQRKNLYYITFHWSKSDMQSHFILLFIRPKKWLANFVLLKVTSRCSRISHKPDATSNIQFRKLNPTVIELNYEYHALFNVRVLCAGYRAVFDAYNFVSSYENQFSVRNFVRHTVSVNLYTIILLCVSVSQVSGFNVSNF